MWNKVISSNEYRRWIFPSSWLIFLAFYFIRWFIAPISWSELLIQLSVLVLFLFCYFWSYYKSDKERLIAACGMMLCGAVAAPYNPGASVFMQFASYFFGKSTNPLKALTCLIMVLAVIIMLTLLFGLPLPSFTLPAILVSTALCVFGILDRWYNITNIKLEQNEREVERVGALAERERIARDLHDLLGHTLSVITLKSNLASKLIERGEHIKASTEVAEIEATSRKALRMMQDVISDYKDIALEEEIRSLAGLLEQQGLDISLELQFEPIENQNLKKTLSMIIRESVTNIVRHSNASKCSLALSESPNNITLQVFDNGQLDNPIKHGNGLRGMTERAQLAGGTLSIDQNRGLMITVTLPRSN